jgi:murein DD-endopeptidase MepM/ murein hydrolase activator NlpD
LPTIESFRTTPTDQFVVDYPLVASGFPYKGRRAVTPHQGAHVNFEQDYRQWPRGGTAPSNYPPIYAVADGVVDRVTASFDNGATDRYGVNVTIARDGATNWDFEYSIEPMVKEPQAGFYAKFIAVHQGQRVHKGQIIAYMYLPPTPDNSHIHFELINDSDNAFAAPAIFSPEVVRQFSQRWGTQGYDSRSGTTNPIPPCMGWKLAADENPFGSGPLDHL